MLKTTKFALALGGNIGNTTEIFQSVVEKLSQAGVTNLVMSNIYCTDPVDCVIGTPKFYNATLIGEWANSPEELLRFCQHLERLAGRPQKHSSHESRSLDLDLIMFGTKRCKTKFLHLPHPRAQKRRFVLEPLAEIAPDWRFPDSGLTVRECLDNLPSEKLN